MRRDGPLWLSRIRADQELPQRLSLLQQFGSLSFLQGVGKPIMGIVVAICFLLLLAWWILKYCAIFLWWIWREFVSLLDTGKTLEERERLEHAERQESAKRQKLAEQEALRNEHARALNENRDLLNLFRHPVSCVDQVDELMRATGALHGQRTMAKAVEILDSDIADVIRAIAASTGGVLDADGRVYQALSSIVAPTLGRSFGDCSTSLRCRGTNAARLPVTVSILSAYDKLENTSHAAKAAAAFAALVDVVSLHRPESVSKKLARGCYMELFRPFLQGGDGCSSKATSTPHQICTDCAKFYRVLGLELDATLGEVKSSYHFLIKKLHPDVSRPKNESERHLAETKTKELNEAYDHIASTGHFASGP